MFNSNILDVAVGLVFVFLTLSLICSAAKEIIEAGLKKRSKDLETGIRELAGAGPRPSSRGVVNQNQQAAGQAASNQNPAPAPGSANPTVQAAEEFVAAFYNHGLINALYKGKYDEAYKAGNLPSYIPATNFALTVLSLRNSYSQAQKQLPKNVQDALTAFEMKAGDRVDVLQQEVETWFNGAMDRVSGWYKRRTQWVLFGLGLAVAIGVNADAIHIARRLATDSNFRQSVARMAEAANAKPPASPGQAAQTDNGKNAGNTTPPAGGVATGAATSGTDTKAAVNQIRENLASLDGVGLPLGWTDQTIKTPQDFGWSLIGWLITALAISLGAPFWFDILNKVMVVRSTVKPREKSKEEGSKDPTPKK